MDLNGPNATRVFNAWNTAVKLAWGLPQYTRTYFLQKLLNCGYMSAKTELLSRFVNFFHGLRHSASKEVQVLSRYLARNLQSVTGNNLWLVQEITRINPWSCTNRQIKIALHSAEQVDVPLQDMWRLPYLVSLLRQRRYMYSLALTNEEDTLTELINSLVKN